MNCRRIQSILSAYLDGELTGQEMLAVRYHLSSCEYCSDEYTSLQIVKKLLGTLDAVDADRCWSSAITAHAFAGGRPWWEKTLSNEWLSIQLSRPLDTAGLTPRGVRMVRALALSAVFVLLAAVPIHIERMDGGGTGRMVTGLGNAYLPWTSNNKPHAQTISSMFTGVDDTRYMNIDNSAMSAPPHYDVLSASTMPSLVQPTFSSDNSLTLVSTTQK